jgi:ABC-type polysaccharide/polyol phosphate export permease
LIILLPLFIIFHFKVVTLLWLLCIVISIHFVFVLGLGLLFSSLNVFFRDLNHFLSVGIMIWFWLTPIFYSLEMVPFPYRWICFLNPMTHYVILYREILFNCRVPSISGLSLALLISVLSFILGYSFFLKNESALLKKI